MDFNKILVRINDFVWDVPLILIIITVGLLFTYRLKLLQVFHLKKAFKFTFSDEQDGVGEVSSFGALCTALSATVGTGNIIGVATALCVGGPGSLLWMIVAAFFGMATKYAEGCLAVKYRKIDKNGSVLGGPFYYIETGIKERFGWNFKWLGSLFAIFGTLAGLLGIGTITQVNGITNAFNVCFPSKEVFAIGKHSISLTTVIVGFIVTLFAAFVIIGGLKRIARVAEIFVPFMIVTYIGCCLILILCNLDLLIPAIVQIVKGAFNPTAVTGGTVGTIFVTIQKGIARGIFSNESGLGSAPIAAAAAKTNEPARQGLVCMTGTFIDTFIVCIMTGISIVITGSWNLGLEGASVTINAFTAGLPFNRQFSTILLSVCLAAFAFTTILGWNYYSEKCLHYLVGDKKGVLVFFRWLYILAVLIGPYLTVGAVWTIADIFNGLMALPNLIALILLSGVVTAETKGFIDRNKKAKNK